MLRKYIQIISYGETCKLDCFETENVRKFNSPTSSPRIKRAYQKTFFVIIIRLIKVIKVAYHQHNRARESKERSTLTTQIYP